MRKVDTKSRIYGNKINKFYMRGRIVYNPKAKKNCHYGRVIGFYERQKERAGIFAFKVALANGKVSDWDESSCSVTPLGTQIDGTLREGAKRTSRHFSAGRVVRYSDGRIAKIVRPVDIGIDEM